MYRISELAAAVGLSRTALLYYEKQQLISGKRLENGYRLYSDKDLQRVRLIQQLQAGGLTLKECKVCLEKKIDRDLLKNRLRQLDEDIALKQQSRALLAAMLGEGDLRAWHEDLEKVAPDAHLNWLVKQGFSEKEALRLKWLSKDMNDHETYMNDFMKVYETLERWGPGSEKDTLKALSLVPEASADILEIGCGKGLSTRVLMENTEASITAIDNEPSALARLKERFEKQDISGRLSSVCVSMTELPFEIESFGLIWSEGSAYIMGVQKALTQWKPILRPGGFMVVSDLVWLTDNPDQEAMAHWQQDYPDMQTISTRLKQMNAAGYNVVDHFSLSRESWDNYCEPLKKRIHDLSPVMPDSLALKNIETELEIYRKFLGQFGYQMFVLAACRT
ncbi:MerR family transcriptional regulator [Endozoicomonas sp. 8E]|uniref:MerR family transcriptional regulator n=1 Tax=Endozoicomonas sp. 8E TaxID=3035692 RepID=UPI002938DFF2|nr:MerR family transcriptional regulator [Endozoicomonas sp. 8E]WOG26787.1 MerR family transcriptional regulator [Endozoicomonas sp. 8E]